MKLYIAYKPHPLLALDLYTVQCTHGFCKVTHNDNKKIISRTNKEYSYMNIHSMITDIHLIHCIINHIQQLVGYVLFPTEGQRVPSCHILDATCPGVFTKNMITEGGITTDVSTRTACRLQSTCNTSSSMIPHSQLFQALCSTMGM